MSVFTTFSSAPHAYTFLEIERTSQGETVKESYTANGIFKLRDGMVENDSIESETADATLRIRPDETFASLNMVGHGIQMGRGGDTQDYRILSQVEGYDYDLNRVDFYKVELKREEFVWDELSSPLV